MELNVEIDAHSGFCYGVVRAIEQAEKYLDENKELNSLGSIVHNSTEIDRLKEKGLRIIDYDQLSTLKDKVLFIRAHGEPPSSYKIAKSNNLRIIDCTCPVVLKLQERVKDNYKELKKNDGQLLIFGKHGHAEVNGLIGQVDGDAFIIEKKSDLDLVDYSKPIYIFSQTTKDPEEYRKICELIKQKIASVGGPIEKFRAYNTICGQVSSRHPHLKDFAKKHSVIIFVSGKESSNGKILYELCQSVNPRSYSIENMEEIDKDWFRDGDSVGVCGATSTPKWLLEKVAEYLNKLANC